MSKGNVEVLTADQVARVNRIKQYEAACRNSFSAQMGYAFLTGFELNAAKEELPHGKFAAWREANLPELPERSAQRYMKFAEQIRHSGGIADSGKLKLLGNGDLNEKDKEKVLEAVHEIADGKTLTQLYRDLGVIREKKPVVHHPRKPTTPEDDLKAKREQALGLFNSWMIQTKTLLLDPDPTLAELTRDERQQMLDAGTQLNAALRKFLTKKHS